MLAINQKTTGENIRSLRKQNKLTVEKLIERLEKTYAFKCVTNAEGKNVFEIISDLAEEYKGCAPCHLGSPCEYQNKDAILPVELLTDNNGWISVEDTLPKESMPVLVTTGTEMIWTAFYDRTHGTWVDDVRGKVLNVIAWQPLPAPYKKGE